MQKGTGFPYCVHMVLVSGLSDNTAGAPTVTISKDGGAYGAIGTAPTQIGSTNTWTGTFTDAEANANIIELIATKAGDNQVNLSYYPEANYTAVRAGYLDVLNGLVAAIWAYIASGTTTMINVMASLVGVVPATTIATAVNVNAITTNTARGKSVVPDQIFRPDSGSTAYEFDLLIYSLQGAMEAPDAAPVVHARNAAGDSLDASLASTTMTLIATGRYKVTFNVADTDPTQEVLLDFTWIVGGFSTTVSDYVYVVDLYAVDFTSTDRTNLQDLANSLPSGGFPNAADWTAARAALVDHLDDDVTSRMATFTYTAPATPTNVTDAAQSVIGALPAIDGLALEATAQSILTRVTTLQGVTITARSDDDTPIYDFSVVQNAYYEKPITFEGTLPATAAEYRFTVRGAGGPRHEILSDLIVPNGNIFTLLLQAPAAGDYVWDIEPRDSTEKVLPTLISGRITSTIDVTLPTDWTA